MKPNNHIKELIAKIDLLLGGEYGTFSSEDIECLQSAKILLQEILSRRKTPKQLAKTRKRNITPEDINLAAKFVEALTMLLKFLEVFNS